MKKTAILFFLLLFSTIPKAFTQGLDTGFTYYRPNRIAPSLTYWHEVHFSSNLVYDLDYKERTEGNFKRGINYGVGLGYMFKIGLDDMPQNLGIGLKAEYFPNRFYKFNIMTDFKLLAIGNQNIRGSFLGGWELNISYTPNFKEKEMHTILYLLDVQYRNWELKWGLQSWYDDFIPYTLMDHGFSNFKLTHKIVY
jgi:hypothetical protein